MIEYFRTIDNVIQKIGRPCAGCWINLINPSNDEIMKICSEQKIEISMLKAALDEEETSRAESDDGNVLIIIDIPSVHNEENKLIYATMPLGIIVTEACVITVCLRDTSILSDFAEGYVKNVQTSFKTRFLLMILLRAATRFLQYLRQIDKLSISIEKKLQVSMKNKEIIQLLELEKSLIYFTTSLRANQSTLNKIARGGGRYVKLYEEDQDLLEDVLIEIAQASEMSQIYSSILIGTSDTFASIISNNLSIVMKRFTVISILMTIPTIITSFYGMNMVGGLPFEKIWWFPIMFSLGGIIIAWVFLSLTNKRMK